MKSNSKKSQGRPHFGVHDLRENILPIVSGVGSGVERVRTRLSFDIFFLGGSRVLQMSGIFSFQFFFPLPFSPLHSFFFFFCVVLFTLSLLVRCAYLSRPSHPSVHGPMDTER